MGLLHIYCGDGKGKTSAAIGQAVRMAGCGQKVVIVRFLKDDTSGEVESLCRLPEVDLLFCRETFGFTWQMTEEDRCRAKECYTAQFQLACRKAEEYCRMEDADADPVVRTGTDMDTGTDAGTVSEKARVLLVCDELCAAVNSGLLELSEVLEFLDHRPGELEVVITGRNPHEELLERADYVTEMKLLKHPFLRGIPARRGIEY